MGRRIWRGDIFSDPPGVSPECWERGRGVSYDDKGVLGNVGINVNLFMGPSMWERAENLAGPGTTVTGAIGIFDAR